MHGHVDRSSAPRYTDFRDGVGGRLLALDADTVVFSHFVAINAAIGAATGDDRVVIRSLDNCSVTVIDVDRRRAAPRRGRPRGRHADPLTGGACAGRGMMRPMSCPAPSADVGADAVAGVLVALASSVAAATTIGGTRRRRSPPIATTDRARPPRPTTGRRRAGHHAATAPPPRRRDLGTDEHADHVDHDAPRRPSADSTTTTTTTRRPPRSCCATTASATPRSAPTPTGSSHYVRSIVGRTDGGQRVGRPARRSACAPAPRCAA